MYTIEINSEFTSSKVFVGERIENFKKHLPNKKVIIITDENIVKHYGKHLKGFPIIQIGLGEVNKTMKTLEFIFSKLVEFEADRSTFILAVGGGIVCDVVGFAASTYMRGLPFGFISTTLLSQVDASVGGKNGVNFEGFKNMIGVFNQPEFVICDTNMLKTLDSKEFYAGFAEIIKAGAIRDEKLFEYLENNYSKALSGEPEVLDKVVYDSVQMKANVVMADEREKGERRILNFGHTFAHSIEKHGGVLHGEAVAIGMVLAARLSQQHGLITNNDVDRIEQLIKNFKLPTTSNIDASLLYEHMKKDKKREGNIMHMVLLNKIGEAVIKPVEINKLEGIVYDLC